MFFQRCVLLVFNVFLLFIGKNSYIKASRTCKRFSFIVQVAFECDFVVWKSITLCLQIASRSISEEHRENVEDIQRSVNPLDLIEQELNSTTMVTAEPSYDTECPDVSQETPGESNSIDLIPRRLDVPTTKI